MKPPGIIQARMGSSRLPGKVLAPIGDKTMLRYQIERCRLSERVGEILVATTTSAGDDPVVTEAARAGARVFRGSESDVLSRYLGAVEMTGGEALVRLTADSPLVSPSIIDDVLRLQTEAQCDYAYWDGYPLGIGAAEVVTTAALRRSAAETTLGETYYREHVITYVTSHSDRFKVCLREAPARHRRSDFRLTVDEAADLDVVRFVCEYFLPRVDISLDEIFDLLDRHPEMAAKNRHVRQKT